MRFLLFYSLLFLLLIFLCPLYLFLHFLFFCLSLFILSLSLVSDQDDVDDMNVSEASTPPARLSGVSQKLSGSHSESTPHMRRSVLCVLDI